MLVTERSLGASGGPRERPGDKGGDCQGALAHIRKGCGPGPPAVVNALERWRYEIASIDKPEHPPFRGVLTITDMQGVGDPDAHDYGVELWAHSTWNAHSALHPLAQQWVRQAIAQRRGID